MDNLILSFNVVAPLFLCILLFLFVRQKYRFPPI